MHPFYPFLQLRNKFFDALKVPNQKQQLWTNTCLRSGSRGSLTQCQKHVLQPVRIVRILVSETLTDRADRYDLSVRRTKHFDRLFKVP